MDTMKLKKVFGEFRVEASYLFGSQVAGNATPQSDVDIAVLLPDSIEFKARFRIRLQLMEALSRILKKEVEVVVLNDVQSLFFKYVVISEGKLLFQKNEEKRISFENRITALYFDFEPFLDFYHKQYVKSALS